VGRTAACRGAAANAGHRAAQCGGQAGRRDRVPARAHAFFERHALDAAAYANTILHRADAHWIDETGLPIEVQYLRAVRDAYHESDAIALARRFEGILGRLPVPVRSFLHRLARRKGGSNTIAHPTSRSNH